MQSFPCVPLMTFWGYKCLASRHVSRVPKASTAAASCPRCVSLTLVEEYEVRAVLRLPRVHKACRRKGSTRPRGGACASHPPWPRRAGVLGVPRTPSRAVRPGFGPSVSCFDSPSACAPFWPAPGGGSSPYGEAPGPPTRGRPGRDKMVRVRFCPAFGIPSPAPRRLRRRSVVAPVLRRRRSPLSLCPRAENFRPKSSLGSPYLHPIGYHY